MTRSYDAENHLLQQNIPAEYDSNPSDCGVSGTTYWAGGGSITNTWGPESRLATHTTVTGPNGSIPGNTTVLTAHWDGDDLLYTTFAGNTVIGIEKLGAVQIGSASQGVIVNDRDWTGTTRQTHWIGGFSVWSLNSPFIGKKGPGSNCGSRSSESCSNPPQTLALDMSRSDGYYDGFVSYQGVRAYDPNMNQWTSPDAYSGDVHDPMSQKPYMWNDNNPVEYGDPAGTTPLSCTLEM